MNPPLLDFKTIMLLLSAALGLSFIVERILEALNGILNKVLLSDKSPFAEKAPPMEVILQEKEIQKISNILEERVEELEEIRVQLGNGASLESFNSTQDRPSRKDRGLTNKKRKELEKRLHDLEIEVISWRNKLSQKIRAQLEDKTHKLSSLKRIELNKKLEELQAEEKNGKIDTSKLELEERFSEATIIIDPVTAMDPEKTARIFWLQIIGTFSGVLICYFSKFGIFHQLFGIFSEPNLQPDWILTGILIGAGSQPIHFLIKFITQRKVVDLKVSTKETVKSEEKTVSTIPVPKVPSGPAVITKPQVPAVQIDIPYQGGVDRDILETRHKRIKNPDLIVYHHTAMHSDTSFADVVKVIKDKNWVTGYNCVILKDGSIYPFCRWDRFGNHAKGYNRRSLGIALNGNFEPNPKIPFANVNGRLGILRPTDAQLHSACKVVALWCHLYNIPMDFKNSIIPHNEISTKTCPGSEFPYDRFKELVDTIYTQWEKSSLAQQELELFKQKQYLYV